MLLDRHPDIGHLFGPVSISAQFSVAGRFLIMTALQLHHTYVNLKPLVRPRNALRHINEGSEVHFVETFAACLSKVLPFVFAYAVSGCRQRHTKE